MLLIIGIISIIVACILSFLIIKVWSKPNETSSSVSTSHPELGAVGPGVPNNGPTSGGENAPGSNNSGGNPLKPQPGQQGTGNSEG
jgi:hypothetical protein